MPNSHASEFAMTAFYQTAEELLNGLSNDSDPIDQTIEKKAQEYAKCAVSSFLNVLAANKESLKDTGFYKLGKSLENIPFNQRNSIQYIKDCLRMIMLCEIINVITECKQTSALAHIVDFADSKSATFGEAYDAVTIIINLHCNIMYQKKANSYSRLSQSTLEYEFRRLEEYYPQRANRTVSNLEAMLAALAKSLQEGASLAKQQRGLMRAAKERLIEELRGNTDDSSISHKDRVQTTLKQRYIDAKIRFLQLSEDIYGTKEVVKSRRNSDLHQVPEFKVILAQSIKVDEIDSSFARIYDYFARQIRALPQKLDIKIVSALNFELNDLFDSMVNQAFPKCQIDKICELLTQLAGIELEQCRQYIDRNNTPLNLTLSFKRRTPSASIAVDLDSIYNGFINAKNDTVNPIDFVTHLNVCSDTLYSFVCDIHENDIGSLAPSYILDELDILSNNIPDLLIACEELCTQKDQEIKKVKNQIERIYLFIARALILQYASRHKAISWFDNSDDMEELTDIKYIDFLHSFIMHHRVIISVMSGDNLRVGLRYLSLLEQLYIQELPLFPESTVRIKQEQLQAANAEHTWDSLEQMLQEFKTMQPAYQSLQDWYLAMQEDYKACYPVRGSGDANDLRPTKNESYTFTLRAVLRKNAVPERISHADHRLWIQFYANILSYALKIADDTSLQPERENTTTPTFRAV